MTLGSILLLILSTLATTTTFQARCTMRGLTAATGLVQQSPERMHTSWTSIAPMSSLRITTVVATVTLFAVSGGERRDVSPLPYHTANGKTVTAGIVILRDDSRRGRTQAVTVCSRPSSSRPPVAIGNAPVDVAIRAIVVARTEKVRFLLGFNK